MSGPAGGTGTSDVTDRIAAPVHGSFVLLENDLCLVISAFTQATVKVCLAPTTDLRVNVQGHLKRRFLAQLTTDVVEVLCGRLRT